MTSATIIRVPAGIGERLRREAERFGLTLDEYVIELLTRDLDPPKRAVEYIDAAKELLEEARIELEKSNVRQAAEKAWGATALAVRAYAAWRDGKRLTSHGELWGYKRTMARELGDWVSDAWYAGQSMHICFYEGWCAREDVEDALKRIERLVNEVAKRVSSIG